MERVTEPKNSFFKSLLDNYPNTRKRPYIKSYPQMPGSQIQHYIKQAVRQQKQVSIQLNPSTFSDHLTEVTGTIKFSPSSSHIVLITSDEQTVHLIQPHHIRHLCLSL